MSNRLSRASKGNKKPSVRQDEFVQSVRATDEKLQRLHYTLMYQIRNIETKFDFFVKYLTEKGKIDEKDYKDYLEDMDKKMKLADEISKDESLNREEKIKKAKESDIPEEWVAEKEAAPEEKEEVSEEVENLADNTSEPESA